MSRRRVLAITLLGVTGLVFLWNVSRPGTRVAGCLEGCAATGSGGDASLRVISLNMLHGHPDFDALPQRLELIAAEIQHQKADLVLLQEVPWTRQTGNAADFLARETGLNHAFLRANGNRFTIFFEEGEAILSRYPLRNLTFTELKPQAGFFEHRMVLHATVSSPNGDFDVFVTHLTNQEQALHQAQTAALKDFVDRQAAYLAIIAGDFNATEEEPAILNLTNEWIDVFREVHPTEKGATCCIDDLHSAPSEPLTERIDYQFLRAPEGTPFEILEAQVILDRPVPVAGGWLWASDHAGLLTVWMYSGYR